MTLTLRAARLVGAGPDLVDVTLRDGRVESIRPTTAPSAIEGESLDLDGRFLGPSMRDAHVHFSQWAMLRSRIDVSEAESALEAAALLRGHAGGTERLVGHGFRDGLWTDSPHWRLLDAVSTDQQIVIVSGDLHCVWLNSTALTHYGFGGHPTGLLREHDAVTVTSDIARVDESMLDAWVQDAAHEAARRGVTEIVELEWTRNTDDWTRRVQGGNRSLRVHVGVYPPDLDDIIARGLRTGDLLPDTEGLVQMGPLKIITDGSLNTRTAFCHAPYPDLASSETGRGLAHYTFEGLTSLMSQGHERGLVPAVHAIGDAANRLALDAFAEVGCRGTIEHAQLLDSSDFPRFAELGIVASVQPEHAMDDRDIAERHWPGRTGRSFAFGELIAAGAEVALGSDAPVAPLDPWISMAAAIFRARDGREPWHPEQRMHHEDAYRSSTTGRRTRVSVGEVADMVVSDADPLDAGDSRLRAFPVAATLLGGEFTHRTL